MSEKYNYEIWKVVKQRDEFERKGVFKQRSSAIGRAKNKFERHSKQRAKSSLRENEELKTIEVPEEDIDPTEDLELPIDDESSDIIYKFVASAFSKTENIQTNIVKRAYYVVKTNIR